MALVFMPESRTEPIGFLRAAEYGFVMHEPTAFSREALAIAGFSGFLQIATFRKIGLTGIPDEPGCYVVLREAEAEAAFLDVSPAGRFKGRDPTIPVDQLRAAWIEGCNTIYIGQSGSLRERWKTRLDFGAGKPVGAWGGRAIWQLTDAEKLRVAWRRCEEGQPPKLDESSLLAEFVAQYGRLPFANRRG
jgi:hypothetical protein